MRVSLCTCSEAADTSAHVPLPRALLTVPRPALRKLLPDSECHIVSANQAATEDQQMLV